MTNTQQYAPEKYMGNDLTCDFAFSFKIFSETDLEIFIEESGVQSKLDPDNDYDVVFSDTGGSVNLNSPPRKNQFLIIARNVQLEQVVTYSTSTGFSAETVETGFDKDVAMLQQLAYDGKRAIRVPLGSENLNLSLPTPQKGKTLKWSDDEKGLINSYSNIDEIGEAVELAITSSDGAIRAAENAQNIVDNATSSINSSVNEVNELLNETKNYTEQAQFYAERSEKPLTPFCVNSGVVDFNGNSCLLSLDGDCLTATSPFVYTLADGRSYKRTEPLTFDITNLTAGNYNIFFNHDSQYLGVLQNKIFYQKISPSSSNNGDVWLDTSCEPFYSKVFDVENWIIKNIVPLGVLELKEDEELPPEIQIDKVNASI